MKSFKVVCRGSRLSLAQAAIFKARLMEVYPQAEVGIVIKETEGDINQIQPLAEMEGKDFFTKDIQDVLLRGEADFAVHSLKDVSGEEFFKNNTYAIIEREDPRDVAIFHTVTEEKIRKGQRLRMGTSSPRRAEMALDFLAKGLPILEGKAPSLEAVPIRGNVDTRLLKLDRNEYDGIILACAGLNRLLRSELAREDVSRLLLGKRLMFLPLLECPPAPGQGAIVAETIPDNADAIQALKSINDVDLAQAVSAERLLAHKYGSGCHQKFGVIHVQRPASSFTYASGRDRKGDLFTEVVPAGSALVPGAEIPLTDVERIFKQRQIRLLDSIEENPAPHVWVSQTSLWFEFAKRGTWVEGSAEGFGVEFIEDTLASPLVANRSAK